MNDNLDSVSAWVGYLDELRKRLLKYLFVVVAFFFILFPFAQTLFQLLATPLIKQLPSGMHLIVTSITASFFVPVKLCAILSFFCALPYGLFQAWRFVGPALYPRERNWFWPIFSLSLLLFILGIIFAYTLVFPFIFKFLIQSVPIGVHILPDIGEYLAFCLQMFLAFGLAFQVPLIIIVLVLVSLLSVDNLVRKRPYIIVGAFILGMIFSPPDVLSQLVLAIPLWLLFEIGILLARWLIRYQK